MGRRISKHIERETVPVDIDLGGKGGLAFIGRTDF
jgi:hypothetical protein